MLQLQDNNGEEVNMGNSFPNLPDLGGGEGEGGLDNLSSLMRHVKSIGNKVYTG